MAVGRFGWALVTWLAVSPAASAASLADGQRAYDSGGFVQARAIWAGLAEAGDAQAALQLGTLFERGDGVPANPVTAYCWYRHAAADAVPAGAFNVGVMYDSGRGVARDTAAAARWYGRAAAFGFPRAEYNLGQLYEAGEGVPHNLAAAAAWYRVAVAAGLAAAQGRLARLPREPNTAVDPMPQPVSLDAPEGVSGKVADRPERYVPLTWPAVSQAMPVSYYVEVVAAGSDASRPAFSASTALPAMLATLPPGNYAGRVFSVATDASHYAIGPWTDFSVGVTTDLPDCQ